MIWYSQPSESFRSTFPLAERYDPKTFPSGEAPISAICCGYAVLADAKGLVAVPRSTRAYPKVLAWRKELELPDASTARAVIGRAPLTRSWFLHRGWIREPVPGIDYTKKGAKHA